MTNSVRSQERNDQMAPPAEAVPIPFWIRFACWYADSPKGITGVFMFALAAAVVGRVTLGFSDNLIVIVACVMVLVGVAVRIIGDRMARSRIDVRVRRLAMGNPGQHRQPTGGVSELKIDHGPGYRVYYTQRGRTLVPLLIGGDKSTQTQDIERALSLAKQME